MYLFIILYTQYTVFESNACMFKLPVHVRSCVQCYRGKRVNYQKRIGHFIVFYFNVMNLYTLSVWYGLEYSQKFVCISNPKKETFELHICCCKALNFMFCTARHNFKAFLPAVIKKVLLNSFCVSCWCASCIKLNVEYSCDCL